MLTSGDAVVLYVGNGAAWVVDAMAALFAEDEAALYPEGVVALCVENALVLHVEHAALLYFSDAGFLYAEETAAQNIERGPFLYAEDVLLLRVWDEFRLCIGDETALAAEN